MKPSTEKIIDGVLTDTRNGFRVGSQAWMDWIEEQSLDKMIVKQKERLQNSKTTA